MSMRTSFSLPVHIPKLHAHAIIRTHLCTQHCIQRLLLQSRCTIAQPPHHLRDCRSLIFKPHDACYISIRLRPRRQDPIAQCGDDQSTSQVFGIDVESMKPGDVATITADTLGYPLQLVRLLKECAVDVIITAPISILLVQ